MKDLSKLKSILFCVASDSHTNTNAAIQLHQQHTVTDIRNNISKMKCQGGKDALDLLSDQFSKISEQLYVQLFCQVKLMSSFIYNGINFFVQRQPSTLSSFRWRLDNKERIKKTKYEDAYEKYCPGLLQTYSLKNPSPKFSWCDYSSMNEYLYQSGTIPEYLVDEFDYLKEESAYDIQKIMRKDIKFLDSKDHLGIQVADLLASGLRRLLKLDFKNNEIAAALLGNLMIMGISNNLPKQQKPTINFITFENNKKMYLSTEQTRLINIMERSCRPMLLSDQ